MEIGGAGAAGRQARPGHTEPSQLPPGTSGSDLGAPTALLNITTLDCISAAALENEVQQNYPLLLGCCKDFSERTDMEAPWRKKQKDSNAAVLMESKH